MLPPKLNAWVVYPPPETWAGVLAQGEMTVEKAVNTVMQTGKDFGNSNDSVRFGIILVVLICVLGYLAYLYISQVRAVAKDLRERLERSEKRLDDERLGRREDQEQRNAAMQYSISEFITKQREIRRDLEAVFGENTDAVDMLRRLLNLGNLPTRRLEPPMQPPEQPSPPATPRGDARANFLPAGPRRIPRRAQPIEEPKE